MNRHPRPAALACLLLAALLLLLPHAARAQEEPEPPVTPRLMWEMTNEARIANGLRPLAWNEALAEAAQRHAEELTTRSDPGHTGLDGSTPQQRAARVGYPAYPDATRVSENWSTGTALGAMAYFLEDKIHRDNMLLPIWREAGVGHGTREDGQEFWVVLYGARPGVLPIFINDGAARTTERAVTVRLSMEEAGWAPDIFGVPREVRVGEAATIEGAAWQPWAESVPLELSAGGGEKTVVAHYRDDAGKVVEAEATIFLVQGDGPLPTARVQLAPTLTPTATASVTATATATATPTATPIPTITPTPTPAPLAALPRHTDVALLLGGAALLAVGLFFVALLLARRLPRR